MKRASRPTEPAHKAGAQLMGACLVLFWDGGKASYGAVDPEEYPRGPQVGEAKATGMLEGDRFLPALTTAAEYCATDDARPVYVVSESGTVEASRKPDTLEAMPILLVSGDSIMVPSRF